jgi:hypothetical protein
VSVSIGLSALIPNAQNSITTLIDNADEGVYAAKKAGRHRIRISYQEVTNAPLSLKKETEGDNFVDGLRQISKNCLSPKVLTQIKTI